MERKDIAKEYKWNLNDIYENYEKWNEDFEKMKEIEKELVGRKFIEIFKEARGIG